AAPSGGGGGAGASDRPTARSGAVPRRASAALTSVRSAAAGLDGASTGDRGRVAVVRSRASATGSRWMRGFAIAARPPSCRAGPRVAGDGRSGDRPGGARVQEGLEVARARLLLGQ